MASELHVDAIKHSGGTSAMTIDSTGRILTPARPHALVVINLTATGGYDTVANNAVIPFAGIVRETGSNYDTTNYRYVCPVAGLYLVTCQLILDSAANIDIALRLSGSDIHRFFVDSSRQIEFTTTVEATASQYIDFQQGSGGDRNINKAGTDASRYTAASFTLLG